MVAATGQHLHSFDRRHGLWLDKDGKIQGATPGHPYKCLDCTELVVLTPPIVVESVLDSIMRAHNEVANLVEGAGIGVSVCRECWNYFPDRKRKADHICRPEAVEIA